MHEGGDGLAADLRAMGLCLDRRQALLHLSALACLSLAACAGGKVSPDDSGSPGGDSGGDSPEDSPEDSAVDSPDDSPSDSWNPDGECAEIPGEGAGPFPGDGSNGPNVLTLEDVIRSDIRGSIGDLSGTAEGVPLRLRLRVLDASGCAPLPGRAVYIWHCDRDGNYSIYGRADQNYLRGVQVSDADGFVEFTTVFPGCYPGRWPHVHVEVFPSPDQMNAPEGVVKCTQLAFSRADCEAVYATAGYETSLRLLAGLALETDIIFRDGAELQLATLSGDTGAGYQASVELGIAG